MWAETAQNEASPKGIVRGGSICQRLGEAFMLTERDHSPVASDGWKAEIGGPENGCVVGGAGGEGPGVAQTAGGWVHKPQESPLSLWHQC